MLSSSSNCIDYFLCIYFHFSHTKNILQKSNIQTTIPACSMSIIVLFLPSFPHSTTTPNLTLSINIPSGLPATASTFTSIV